MIIVAIFCLKLSSPNCSPKIAGSPVMALHDFCERPSSQICGVRAEISIPESLSRQISQN